MEGHNALVQGSGLPEPECPTPVEAPHSHLWHPMPTWPTSQQTCCRIQVEERQAMALPCLEGIPCYPGIDMVIAQRKLEKLLVLYRNVEIKIIRNAWIHRVQWTHLRSINVKVTKIYYVSGSRVCHGRNAEIMSDMHDKGRQTRGRARGLRARGEKSRAVRRTELPRLEGLRSS